MPVKWIAAAALAAIVISTTGCSPANPYRTEFGISMGSNQDTYNTAAFSGVKDVGATWVRMPFSWKDIEETRGVLTWAQTDGWVSRARAQGRKILGTVTYTPPWAQHPNCSAHPCAPALDKYQAFAGFAAKAAKRYKGKVDAWEVWNEPNEQHFWKPNPQPAGYAQLLKKTYAAIKYANSSATVVFGGLSTHYRNDPRWMTWRTFMDRFYDGRRRAVRQVRHPPVLLGWAADDADADNPFYNLPKTQNYLGAKGRGDKKIWITEFGYETGALTPTKQGERLREALTQVVKWGFVERLFVFCWMDFLINEPNPMTAGLNYADGRPKVSRTMMKNLVLSHD